MDIAKRIKLLEGNALFSSLSRQNIEAIAEKTIFQNVPIHTTFIWQNEPGDLLYIILDGSARVFRLSENGEDVPISIVGKGDVVGEMALLDDAVRSASVESLQDMEVLTVARGDFKEIIEKHPEIGMVFLKVFTKRLRENNTRTEEAMTQSLVDRTYHTLETLSRYFPKGSIPLSHEELAQMIGATRARVSEALNGLEKEGKIILSHKNIHIL